MLRSLRSLRAIKNSPLAACLCLAASGVVSSAQQDLQSAAALSEITVRGTVIDAITKQPIARALVQSGDSDAVLTDSNGNFEFPDIPPGPESLKVETITVRRPGYITNSQDQQGFQPSQNQTSTFQVSIRADMGQLTLPLTPESIITGRIASADSDPEDGIQVSAYRKAVEHGRSTWVGAGFGTTNSEGVFRIASLPAGTYLVHADPPPDSSCIISDDPSCPAYPAVYFPGVIDFSAGGSLTIAPGERKQADINLIRQTFYVVIIKVANSQAGDSASLTLTDSGGRLVPFPLRFDPVHQTFHLHLPPGTYFPDVSIFDPHNPNTQLVGRTEFSVTTAPAYVGVTVVPTRVIPVIIHREFTAPTGPMVTRHNPGTLVNLIDGRDSVGVYGGQLEPLTGSNDDDTYRIINTVPPGKYWVEVDAFQGYVSCITCGGVDLTHDLLTVGAGGSSAPIEITLRNDTGSIDGTVTNTQATPNGETHHTSIYAIPLFNTTSQLQTVTVDSSGKFSFSMLAPGSYRIIASDTQLQIEYHNPEVLSALSNKGQVVIVEPGGAAHTQLDITPTAEAAQ